MQCTKERASIENDVFRDVPKNKNKKLYFTLPIAPSVNNLYITKRNGSKVLSRAAHEYIAKSKAIIKRQIVNQKWRKQDASVWYYIDLVVYMPDRKIRDASNMLKILLDVMQGEILDNDYYSLCRIQSVEYDREDPRIQICVSSQSPIEREKAKKMVTFSG